MNLPGTITLATRGSPLARAQTVLACAHLAARLPGVRCETLVVTTTGDRRMQWKLREHGGKGLFTKELEDALLEGRADIAVHSAKDLPAALPDGLAIAGFLPRGDPRDVLVRRAGCDNVIHIASGSQRRREQGAKLWPQAEWTELRGNVETRLRKIAGGQADATIMAAAGLARLGIAEYPGLSFEPISIPDMLPAAGQAAIALECRAADLPAFAPLFDAETAIAVGVERAVLAALGGGCHSAVAAYYDGATLRIRLPGGNIITAPLKTDSLENALVQLPALIEMAKRTQP
ncbi:MAG: hydroxymethylbilane synthase [Opitutales bacterium]|jgi:hydroxymethylbilane synthase